MPGPLEVDYRLLPWMQSVNDYMVWEIINKFTAAENHEPKEKTEYISYSRLWSFIPCL